MTMQIDVGFATQPTVIKTTGDQPVEVKLHRWPTHEQKRFVLALCGLLGIPVSDVEITDKTGVGIILHQELHGEKRAG